ncbi:hypothetical protein NUW58_g3852 [Xylaria curta]|uniref:Uncharacterized protein n=1 Tax=Xylaria curta TaxID=42375 RepID=A0ACC1P901_9PEZI|nr:hypothetical protein NUW58_g3852 [Xylaria curta]
MAISEQPTPASKAALVTHGGTELALHAIPVLTQAFQNDPLFNYFMAGFSEDERREYLPTLIGGLVKASTLNKGIIYEASSWGSCAIMMPAGRKAIRGSKAIQCGALSMLLQLNSEGLKRVLVEHPTAVKRAKKKVFTPKEISEFLYIFIIGTASNRQRQGLGGVLLEHMKAYAHSQGRALWLEASNANARRLYAKHGFQDVEEFTFGEGLVGPDGLAKKGGEGVKNWAMVWRPELKKE